MKWFGGSLFLGLLLLFDITAAPVIYLGVSLFSIEGQKNTEVDLFQEIYHHQSYLRWKISRSTS